MSFDHWWFGLVLPGDTISALREPFDAAKARAHLTPSAHQALTTWAEHPEWFESAAVESSDNAAQWVDAFIKAFTLPGFDQFARAFCKAEGAYAGLMREDTVSGFIVMPSYAPVAVLWHALGAQTAGALPGLMGNMCLPPDAVGDAALAVSRTLGSFRHADLVAAMRRFCGPYATDDLLEQVLRFLPDGLSRAVEQGNGFLALALARI